MSVEIEDRRRNSVEIVLNITGMTCSGCVNAVRRVLSSVPAVTDVAVDLGSGRARIASNDTIDAATLIAAVEDAGYAAEVAA